MSFRENFLWMIYCYAEKEQKEFFFFMIMDAGEDGDVKRD